MRANRSCGCGTTSEDLLRKPAFTSGVLGRQPVNCHGWLTKGKYARFICKDHGHSRGYTRKQKWYGTLMLLDKKPLSFLKVPSPIAATA